MVASRKIKTFFADARQQFGEEHFRQGFVIERVGFVGFAGFRAPQPFIGINSRRRHDHRHMSDQEAYGLGFDSGKIDLIGIITTNHF